MCLSTLARAQSSSDAIGRVETLIGNASVVRGGNNNQALRVGDRVFNNDTVLTGTSSVLGITFLDGTVFSLSANSKMIIDDLVYRATGSSNKMLVDLAKGTFVFLAGKIARSGDMRVDTPVAQIGIRGTQPWVIVRPDQTSFTIMSERNGKTGEYVLFRKGTRTVIATVNRATVGTTRKYVMSGPNDTPRLVNKTPGEQSNEPQLKQQLYATVDARDARLDNGSNRPVEEGLRKTESGFGNFYVELGGGFNSPKGNRDFGNAQDFATSTEGKLGAIGYGEIGFGWDNLFGDVGVSLGLVGQFQN